LSKGGYLLDVNVLVALIDDSHTHHPLVVKWFDTIKGQQWGICAFTEAGFLRVMTRPTTGILTVREATGALESLSRHPGYQFWPLSVGWSQATAPFSGRIFGHQQITDAYLLGLAVQEDGVFVTLDKAIHHMAGPEFSRNLLVLE